MKWGAELRFERPSPKWWCPKNRGTPVLILISMRCSTCFTFFHHPAVPPWLRNPPNDRNDAVVNLPKSSTQVMHALLMSSPSSQKTLALWVYDQLQRRALVPWEITLVPLVGLDRRMFTNITSPEFLSWKIACFNVVLP